MSELADLNAMPLAAVGFVLGSIGGLGSELLDRFAGRSLEIYCRVKKNRDRFGSVLDHQDTVIRAGAYLHVIGSCCLGRSLSSTASMWI